MRMVYISAQQLLLDGEQVHLTDHGLASVVRDLDSHHPVFQDLTIE